MALRKGKLRFQATKKPYVLEYYDARSGTTVQKKVRVFAMNEGNTARFDKNRVTIEKLGPKDGIIAQYKPKGQGFDCTAESGMPALKIRDISAAKYGSCLFTLQNAPDACTAVESKNLASERYAREGDQASIAIEAKEKSAPAFVRYRCP